MNQESSFLKILTVNLHRRYFSYVLVVVLGSLSEVCKPKITLFFQQVHRASNRPSFRETENKSSPARHQHHLPGTISSKQFSSERAAHVDTTWPESAPHVLADQIEPARAAHTKPVNNQAVYRSQAGHLTANATWCTHTKPQLAPVQWARTRATCLQRSQVRCVLPGCKLFC